MDVVLNTDKIVKGKPIADKISEGLKQEVENLNNMDIHPKLAMIRVGSREDVLAYQRGATKKCESVGIKTEVIELNEEVTQEEYISALESLNNNASVNGILCFTPLPSQLDENTLKHMVNVHKDIDCFNPINISKLVEGDKSGFAPCTAQAVIEILKEKKVDLQGKNITIIGRSMIVGKPVAMLLLNEDATVTICHSKTKNIKDITSKADILVVAIGRAKAIDKDYIKEGAIVIDVGINVDENGKLCGDVHTHNVADKVSMITPVPAGVGSVTTSILAKNVIKACKSQNNI